MDGEEIFDAFNASGSAAAKFRAGMFRHEEIKQENFDGWDAAAWIINSIWINIINIKYNIIFIHPPLAVFILLSYSPTVSQSVMTCFLIFHNTAETKVSKRGSFFLFSDVGCWGNLKIIRFFLLTIIMKFGTLFPNIVNISWYIWVDIKISYSGLFFPFENRGVGVIGSLQIIIIFITCLFFI